MKQIQKYSALPAILVLTACQFFLGPDPGGSPVEIFDALWKDFNETYALMDIKMDLFGSDWDQVYRDFSPDIFSGMTDHQLFKVCAEMLETLNDVHVNLFSPFAEANSGGRFNTAGMEPFRLDTVRTYLDNNGTTGGDGMFLYGKFISNPDIGYIFIAGFASGAVGVAGQDWTKSIDGIIQALADTSALVVDVRGNRGGLPANVSYIAARFAAAQKGYAQVRTKNGPGRNDFSDPITAEIIPDGTRYTKPIALLTNKQTVSAGEWFTLAMRSQDHVTHAGSTTNGAFSLSLQRPLSNGWLYTISVQKITDMNEECYEGIGIEPYAGHEITNTAGDIAQDIDRQLEYAMDLAQKKAQAVP